MDWEQTSRSLGDLMMTNKKTQKVLNEKGYKIEGQTTQYKRVTTVAYCPPS